MSQTIREQLAQLAAFVENNQIKGLSVILDPEAQTPLINAGASLRESSFSLCAALDRETSDGVRLCIRCYDRQGTRTATAIGGEAAAVAAEREACARACEGILSLHTSFEAAPQRIVARACAQTIRARRKP